MKVDDCIFFQLAKASQRGTQYWGQQVSNLDLTGVQAMVLIFIGDDDKKTSGHLGERVHLTSATLTGIIDRLEKSGLVERKPSPTDRRATLICLTRKGSEIVVKLNKLFPEANREFLKEIGPDEEIIFRRTLEKLRG